MPSPSSDSHGVDSPVESPAQLRERVAAWIADDPDPVTRARLEALLEVDSSLASTRAAEDELADAFDGTLQFGTAGLRGRMGAGPNRMNRAVVIRAAAAVASFLQSARSPEIPTVVIGYDARHNSQTFAADTAAVMAAAGVRTYLLPRALPTPVLAYAVRHLNTDAGIMVTASHNPAEDNGYKVYLGGGVVDEEARGVQLVAPHDADIAARIAACGPIREIPRAESGWDVVGEALVSDYIAEVGELGATHDAATPRDIKVVYTPLHGVGKETFLAVLANAGYTDVITVAEQGEPDPDFHTVGFPNPEEQGAIDLALAQALVSHADIVVANDPDADRCAVAVPDPRATYTPGPAASSHEDWRMLHGDEVGALLGQMIGTQAARMRIVPEALTMANSVVSSRLLSKIAASFGFTHATTLTGFKWIARTPNLIFGYEEAIGYAVAPHTVRDKDGISAGLMLVQLADQLKAEGRTLLDALDDLARAHGLYTSGQLSARFTDLALIPRVLETLRANPPSSLAGSPVVEVSDLSKGYQGLPPTDGIAILAADDTRVIVRPSGTEPKVKCYFEVVTPVEPDASFEDLTHARGAAQKHLRALREEMTEALGLNQPE